ncbi:MAG: M14 family metallopeptidase [Kiloniellales bacterium]
MTASGYFSADYFEARARFLAAAQAAGARLTRYDAPAAGPDGEALTTDTAWLGPRAAERVLVTISATHGAEGFCGSGVQLGWFASGLHRELPPGLALLAIHAINPYGFAWLRRVTEDNVDLNRNFIDHAAPYPVNAGYDALHEALCPHEWNDAAIAEGRKVLGAYREAHGAWALQRAIAGGQYSHADGIFFGGHAYTWSHDTLLRILTTELAEARHVAVIDYHTGLGPRGYGERICVHLPDSDSLARAGQWYDEDITSPYFGSSTSTELFGVNLIGMEAALPQAQLTGIALEYGTLPIEEVKLVLRADNWLHLHGELSSAKGRAIKDQVREAFYQDADDWKDMVWERAVETQRLALKGLAEEG